MAVKSGLANYAPVGVRTLWLDDFVFPDELWAAFQLPIGLAFFMRSTGTNSVVALYPSPAGATECELHLESWDKLVELNPILLDLEANRDAAFEAPVEALHPMAAAAGLALERARPPRQACARRGAPG